MTSGDLPDQVRAHMAALGRKSAATRDMRAVGRLGGKPRKPRACPKCGAPCPTTRAAGAHCRRKRGPRQGKTPERVGPSYADFYAANAPWASEAEARRAWEQLLQDRGASAS